MLCMSPEPTVRSTLKRNFIGEVRFGLRSDAMVVVADRPNRPRFYANDSVGYGSRQLSLIEIPKLQRGRRQLPHRIRSRMEIHRRRIDALTGAEMTELVSSCVAS